MKDTIKPDIQSLIQQYTAEIDNSSEDTAIILAAGHGKRIRSAKSKMLHSIWGTPTVERVYDACKTGIPNSNIILVVGIKAEDIIKVIGKREQTAYAYQAEQLGTGHAVQIGLSRIQDKQYSGTLYVLPGDMGLLNASTMKMFREEYKTSNSDMMVLTGMYEGDVNENQYGRIIRVKETDTEGNNAGEDFGKVIKIMENKDIRALSENEPLSLEYNNRKYQYTREELINNPEFNSGVYAFDYKKLIDMIFTLENSNVQKEIYLTDLIENFNKKGYSVNAISPKEQSVVMGFNDKTVLKTMENMFRHKVYDRLRNVIEIDDPDDFYIAESVVEDILQMDQGDEPLDIRIGKGAHIGKNVKLNYNLHIMKNVYISGNVRFGENVTIGDNVHLSCFPNQKLIIGDNVEILWSDIIKGNIVIGDNSRIESSVNMTGSDEYPLRIGKNVLIKGTSYIFGSIIEDDLNIEHSVIIRKKILRQIKRNGEIQKVKFYLPMPTGVDIIEDL